MSKVDLDKLRSVGHMQHRGQSHTRVVQREDDGKTAGTQTEHWDDHVDAVATPRTARFHISVSNEEE